MKLTAPTGQDASGLEPGPYDAKLVGFGEEDSTKSWAKYPTYYWFDFEITEEGYEGTNLRKTTNPILSPRATARVILEALNGRISAGQGIDTDDYIGLPCIVHVDHAEQDDGSTKTLVTAVTKAKTKGGAKKAKETVPPENEEDFDSIPF